MKLITRITAAAAATLTCAGAFVLPALASTHGTTNTLTFISVGNKMVVFSKTSVGFQETDTTKAGKIIGFDETIFKATSPTSSAGNVTVDIKGGMLYGTFTISRTTGKITNGMVTGGTGIFLTATGTFTAKAISRSKTAVTVTYSS